MKRTSRWWIRGEAHRGGWRVIEGWSGNHDVWDGGRKWCHLVVAMQINFGNSGGDSGGDGGFNVDGCSSGDGENRCWNVHNMMSYMLEKCSTCICRKIGAKLYFFNKKYVYANIKKKKIETY